jgi:hypothetical protein
MMRKERERRELENRRTNKLAMAEDAGITASPNYACRGCGTQGFSRKFCPECPCVVCKSEDHIIIECPFRRRRKRYPKDKMVIVLSGNEKDAGIVKRREKSIQTKRIPRSACAPGTTGEDTERLPEGLPSLPEQPLIHFPNLEEILTTLVENLMR